MSMLLVTGSVVARADRFDDLLALSREHVERSRTEPGCLEHGVYRNAENPERLIFVERWTDREALAAHFALPATRAFAASLSELLAAPAELRVYEANETRI